MIKALSLFQGVDDATVSDFAHHSQVMDLPKGSTLFLQDEPAEWFYVVISGWIKLFRESLEGNEAVIDMATTGHLFGETAVLEDDTHSFGAAAVEQSRVLRLPSALLKKAIKDDNKMALAMLTSLSRHRKRQTREIESLTLQNASQRIGCFLLRLCTLNSAEPIEFKLPYDKSLIAARLGMKSETFSRALNKLRLETDITVKGSTVKIPCMESLSHYACSACSNEFPCSDLY